MLNHRNSDLPKMSMIILLHAVTYCTWKVILKERNTERDYLCTVDSIATLWTWRLTAISHPTSLTMASSVVSITLSAIYTVTLLTAGWSEVACITWLVTVWAHPTSWTTAFTYHKQKCVCNILRMYTLYYSWALTSSWTILITQWLISSFSESMFVPMDQWLKSQNKRCLWLFRRS